MNAFSFRVYPKKGEQYYFIVRVFHNAREMRMYHATKPDELKPETRFEAVTCPEIHYKDLETMILLPYLGEILFHRPKTGSGVVSHEMTHAAIHWARVTKLDLHLETDEGDAEEIIALAIGNLTRQFFIKY